MITRILLLICIACPFMVAGQKATTDSITTYPPDGVYFSFSSLRNGLPGLRLSDLHRSSVNTNMTIRQWSAGENLYYTNQTGEKTALGRDSIWGFSENGNVFIHLGGKFHKINLFGAISYFLESYPTIKSMAPVVTQTQGSSNYRLLSMETGDIYDYNVDNFESLIENDTLLHLEFISLQSPKAKKKKLYSYIEKYNTKHKLVYRKER